MLLHLFHGIYGSAGQGAAPGRAGVLKKWPDARQPDRSEVPLGASKDFNIFSTYILQEPLEMIHLVLRSH